MEYAISPARDTTYFRSGKVEMGNFSMKIRLWGGPACGQIERGEGPASEIWRVATAPAIHVNRPAQPENIVLNVWEYHRSRWKDSAGLPAYLFPGCGEWLLRHWNEKVCDYTMRIGQEPKFCMMPRVVWFEFSNYVQRERPTIYIDHCSEMVGKYRFQGCEILFGDQTQMMAAKPIDPRIVADWCLFYEGARPERDPEEYHREYQGTWPTPTLHPYEREILEAYERGDRPTAIRALVNRRSSGSRSEARAMQRALDGAESEAERMTDDQAVALSVALDSLPSSTRWRSVNPFAEEDAPMASTFRRNRTTVYSGTGDRLFRIVFENGKKMHPEREERLHKQYLQAVKNWGMQYLENSDRL